MIRYNKDIVAAMAGPHPTPITLTSTQHTLLTRLARRQTSSQRLVRRLVHGVANKACILLLAVLQKPARSLHVISNCRQRLIEFMRQR